MHSLLSVWALGDGDEESCLSCSSSSFYFPGPCTHELFPVATLTGPMGSKGLTGTGTHIFTFVRLQIQQQAHGTVRFCLLFVPVREREREGERERGEEGGRE